MGVAVFYLLILQKYIKLKQYPLCLVNILVDFSTKSMIKRGLNGIAYDFFAGYNIINTSNFIKIHNI